jgi:hypothetical protein
MQSLGMAALNRGSTGLQLPTPFYRSLEAAGIRFWRSQLALVVGPGGSGKSVFISNLVAKWKRPTLAFLLDQDAATAASRFAATEMNAPFLDIKADLDDMATRIVLAELGFIQTDFKAESLEDIQLQLDAYIERYGIPPEVVVVDNLGNMTSGYENEWSALKALTLELDIIARNYECLVICAHHTTDEPSTEPLPRSKILGKIAQYPRIIVSVSNNPFTQEFKLAAVKNSSGPQDPTAANPLAFEADLGSMQIREIEGPRFDGLGDMLDKFRKASPNA